MQQENPSSLDQILNQVWAMLLPAAKDPNNPLHLSTLANVGHYGCHMRTVLLHEVWLTERTLICYSQLRSSKIEEIRADPRVRWLFYHPQQHIQLQLAGNATIHTDDALADQQWATIPPSERIFYLYVKKLATPSSEPISGLPDFLLDRLPTMEESEAGRNNFAVISCKINFIDWLQVREKGGNLRAQFIWQGEDLKATWVVG